MLTVCPVIGHSAASQHCNGAAMLCCTMMSKWLVGSGGSLVGLLQGTKTELKQTTNIVMLLLPLEKFLPKMAVS